MAEENKKKTSKQLRLTVTSASSSFTNHEVRPEMVALARQLISDPGFPSEEMISNTARKIYHQYFSDDPRFSE